MSECPDANELSAFVDGALDAIAAAGMDAHIDACTRCQETCLALGKLPDAAPRVRGDGLARYVILDIVGQGAMGTVYAAYDPTLDRKVAVKLLRKQDGDTALAEVRNARLVREAQSLAKISHANVVAVHDVVLVDSEVLIAMEFVEGENLRAWLTRSPRPWSEVITVFRQAGEGLAAAHRAGLVHRDFKLDNVLVAKDGRVKVIDFGLALSELSPVVFGENRAEDLPLAKTQLTRTGMLLGTPAFMAPEQIRAQTANARSDQFSFCVALYQALFGKRPFEGRTVSELLASIEADDLAKRMPTQVPRWVRQAVLRGLRPEPRDRFASMEEVLAAIGRVRGRRNRRLIAAGLVSLVFAGTGAVWKVSNTSSLVAPEERCEQASKGFEKAWFEKRSGAIREKFESSGLPAAGEGFDRFAKLIETYGEKWKTSRRSACEATYVDRTQSEALFDRRMLCLDQARNQVAALTQVVATEVELGGGWLMKTLLAAGDLPPLSRCSNLELLMQAASIPEDAIAREQILALRQTLALADAQKQLGRFQPALEIAKGAVANARQLAFKPVLVEGLLRLGTLSALSGKVDEGEDVLYEAIVVANAAHADELAAEGWIELMGVAVAEERVREGLAWAKAAEAAMERIPPAPHYEIRWLRFLGALHRSSGDLDAAETSYQRALEVAEGLKGDQNFYIAAITNSWATVTMSRGHYREASAMLTNSLSLYEEIFGAKHPSVVLVLGNLGNVMLHTQDLDRATEYFQRALRIADEVLRADHPVKAVLREGLGNALRDQGRFRESIQEHENALRIRRQVLGGSHQLVARSIDNIAGSLRGLGKLDEAIAKQEQALALSEENLSPDSPAVARLLGNLGETLVMRGMRGDYQRAQPLLVRALDIRERIFDAKHRNVAKSLHNLGDLFRHQGDAGRALPLLERAVSILENAESEEALLAEASFSLARAAWELGERSRARRLAHKARALVTPLGKEQLPLAASLDKWLEENALSSQ